MSKYTVRQGELPLINELGKKATHLQPCASVLSDNLSYITPGLDADLCRCPDCVVAEPGGIWWTDETIRRSHYIDRSFFAGHLSDRLRTAEDEARSIRRKNWADGKHGAAHGTALSSSIERRKLHLRRLKR